MSNETKWTPGPWVPYVDKKNGVFSVCIPGHYGKTPCVVNWPGFESSDLPKIQQAANANLIAAAPDLYEALSKLRVAAYEACADSSCNDALEYAEMVLAKARGESHD